MPRVSPYPLRPSRFSKQKAHETESLIETEGERQWEDARCLICMEPPHNAILLHCASYSQGCRPYLCDTSAHHSNCYIQFRRNNVSCFSRKFLKCPLCRGEVFNETMNLNAARRFMNAKPRSCAFEGCEFSGTYSQLEVHSKAEHPRCLQEKVDLLERVLWEQRVRDDEDGEILNATGGNPPSPVEIDDDVMNAGGFPRRLVERDAEIAEFMLGDGFPPTDVERHAEITALMNAAGFLGPRPEAVHTPRRMYSPDHPMDRFGSGVANYAAAFRPGVMLREPGGYVFRLA